ncbi:MAG: TetR/AcrR family transcriptional regulator [Candidatus Methylomirabilis oxyfera]|nr:TetR/AcrR family transcriptional regulator [Candidatus Methylomirabilis oxyfera]
MRAAVRRIETVVKDRALIERRHEQICDAALRLFARKGYHQTSVREIAEAADLSVGALYNYIKTKEDILLLVYHRLLDLFQKRMSEAMANSGDPTSQLRAAIEATLRLYDEYQDLVLVLYQESHTLRREALQQLFEVDRRYVSMLQAIVERGNREGHFVAGDSNLIAIAILFLCAVWPLKRWNLKKYDLSTVTDGVIGLVLNGIGGGHGLSDN